MAKATKKAAAKSSSKGASQNSATKTTAAKGAAKKSGGRQANAAFMAPLTPKPALAEVIGNTPLPRTEIVKKIWDYIKKHNLQDKENKRMINADDKLRPLFGKDQISMFELAKVVNNQIQK